MFSVTHTLISDKRMENYIINSVVRMYIDSNHHNLMSLLYNPTYRNILQSAKQTERLQALLGGGGGGVMAWKLLLDLGYEALLRWRPCGVILRVVVMLQGAVMRFHRVSSFFVAREHLLDLGHYAFLLGNSSL